MADSLPHKEISVNGPHSRLWRLEAAECPELKTHRIARIGWHDTAAPYARVRVKPEGSFFLACVEGEGRILLEGRAQRVAAGDVCLAPPRVLSAFRAVPGGRFVFAWVRYDEPPGVKPLVGAGSPVRGAGGGADIARAVAGLRAEWEGPRVARVVHHWLSLVQELAERLAQPWEGKDRLWQLWAGVEADLAAPWTLPRLAAQAHLSTEHLRRLCGKTHGRSPMQHVTSLRMQRAQTRLETSEDKIEVIARGLGYENADVFARAFKRWAGLTPSDYRSRK